MADTPYKALLIPRLASLKLQGAVFALLGVVLSLVMANVLVGGDVLWGLALSALLCLGGLTLLWFLTTERIDLALLILVFYMGVFEGYLKIQSFGVSFYVVYAVRSVLTVALVLNPIIKRFHRKLDDTGYTFRWPPFSLIIGFYVLWGIISIFHPDRINLLNSLVGLRPHIEFIPLYFLGFMVCRKNPQWFVHLLLTFLIIGVLNSIAAIHQYKIGPDALPGVWGSGYEKFVEDIRTDGDNAYSVRDMGAFSARLYVDNNYNVQLRPPGLGPDHTYPAMVAQIAIFSAVALLFYYLKTKNYWLLGFLVLAGLMLFAGIVVSASRSYLLLTIVGLAVALLFYIREIFSGQKLKIIIVLIVAVTVVVGNYVLRSYVSESVYDRFQNVSTLQKLMSRLEEEKFVNWEYTRRYLLEAPLGRGLGKVGSGAGFFVESVDEGLSYAGNGETEVNLLLSELGIVGLMLFFIVIMGTYLKSLVILRGSAPDSYQRLSSMIVFLYLLVFFINCMWGTGATFPQKAAIWLFMGCFWALYDRPEKFFLGSTIRQRQAIAEGSS